MAEVIVRPARGDDIEFMAAMLVEAACWRPGVARPAARELLARPEIGRYITGWPRVGDRSVIAETTITEDDPARSTNAPEGAGVHSPRRIGAAWYRRFGESDPGFGFVACDVPEVTIGVVAGWRGRGVGRALLLALVDAAGADGLRALSLSVEHDNPARRLYTSIGFHPVARGDGTVTMVIDLPARRA